MDKKSGDKRETITRTYVKGEKHFTERISKETEKGPKGETISKVTREVTWKDD